MNKKIYIVENSTHPNKERTRYFVRASDIRFAHAKGEEVFKGASFTTREPNEDEREVVALFVPIEVK